jgi:hypothetical protein
MLVCWLSPLASNAASPPDQTLNYSYLYFENGYPTRLTGRRPQSEANLAARANPDLVFQTGYYSLTLDCDDMQLKGYDALDGSDYRTALDQDVTIFTPATSLLLRVYRNGTAYDCTNAVVQRSGVDNVRLIESGQYVQRIDHLGLVFKDAGGNLLNVASDCRLEIAAWPDRVTFLLDFSPETANPITRTTIQVVSPDGVAHLADVLSSQARLTLKPQDDVKLGSLNPGDYITQASNLRNGSPLSVSFDPDEHAIHIEVPADPVSYPASIKRVDEYLLEVTNPLAVAENVPLVFEQPSVRAITGTVMLLCDASDGRPLGIPVQISKNWHRDTANPTVHQGSWLRGSTLLTLQPGESRRFKLRVVYGYWGGAGAVSHSQLCLIGYGGHWKWDESALGCWGESLTYDPSQHLGGAFLDDIRPSFTTSYGSTSMYNWTENVGGGDFLIYRDGFNTYHWLKRQKTCYFQTGPNLTEVLYFGVTDDDKIRATYTSRAVSTLDYHRRFHDYKYEFLQNVVSPQRLVFHQMAADYYLSAGYTDYHIGNGTGAVLSAVIEPGGNTYKGSPISFAGKWLSIADLTGGSETARALRGIIPLSSTLNGSAFPLYLHKYGRTWGASTMLFDISADSVTRSYSAGDVVEGALEFVLPPQRVNNYWGGDAELISRLTAYGDTAWEPVRDEFVQNVQMDVAVHQGTLLDHYPLQIQPEAGSVVLADFTVNGGGIGHVPVLLKGAAAGLELKAQRWSGGAWVDLESVDIQNDTYYQGVLNADGSMDYTFSIPRPSLDLNEAWRVRVLHVNMPTHQLPGFELLGAGDFDAVSAATMLQRDDVGLRRYADSAWTVTNGVLRNSSSVDSRVAEGALGQIIALTSLGNGAENQIKLSFDYSTTASSEILYVHLWGYVDVSSTPSTPTMNLGASNGNAWESAAGALIAYNLGKPNAMFASPAGQQWDAAAILTGTTGARSYSGTFDLSAFTTAPDTVSAYDYLALGFTRQIGGAASPSVVISNVVLLAGAAASEQLPYEKWASDFGLTVTNAVFSANPDGDALNNLGEFATGGNPTNAADIGHVPTIGIRNEGGTNVVEYVYARRIGTESELGYHLELATDLAAGNWTNAGYLQLPTPGAFAAGFETVTNRIDTSGQDAVFIRLVIDAF